MFRLIAHRGNVMGPDPRENDPKFVVEALTRGLDVEIDVWGIKDQLYLGHEEPTYLVDLKFILMWQSHLWIHAKNEAAIRRLHSCTLTNWFYQTDAPMVLTSGGYLWNHFNTERSSGTKCIAVLPEKWQQRKFYDMEGFCGVCTDYIVKYVAGKYYEGQFPLRSD